uniref:Uncharacterized protein n=1 Tax=Lactuca sativa TaxID=4236 RepID=A0A9R1X9D4_LACSA|nr:hypothetical protein LSAT_V11C600341830 [Lactuca sativa]
MVHVIVSIHNLSKKPTTYIARKTSSGVWNNTHKSINALEPLHIDCLEYFNLIPGENVKILFGRIRGVEKSHSKSKLHIHINLKKLNVAS